MKYHLNTGAASGIGLSLRERFSRAAMLSWPVTSTLLHGVASLTRHVSRQPATEPV
jgi:hypothetical protein